MIEGCLLIILVAALVFGVVAFEAWIGMLLFNWAMVLFDCAFALNFWQAFAICALLSFVGGFFKSSSKNN